MKKALSFILTLIFLLSVTVVFGGCSGNTVLEKIKSSKDDLKVVGNVGEYEILYEELRCLTLGFKERMMWTYGEDIWTTEESAEKYRAQLENYIMFALTVNSAALKVSANNGIEPDDKKVKEYVELELNKLASDITEDLKIKNGSDNYTPSKKEINDAYEKFLAENHLTDNYYRYILSVNGCLEVLKQDLIEKGTLSSDDETVIQFINDNFIRTLHVYIPIDSATTPEKAKADAELCDWILKTNLNLDSNKDELMEKLGITSKTPSGSPSVNFYNRITDPDKDKMTVLIGSSYNKDFEITQNGYYFSYGEFDKEYEKAAMALEINGISEIVSTNKGYYIIKRLPLESSYIYSNLDTLKQQYHMAYINKLIDTAEQGMSFSFNEYGKTLDLTKIS